MDKETKKEFENLARMIKKGFDENTAQHKEIFDRLEKLEQGQEEIKLKLDQVAYRFELQELERRVRRIELKLGLEK